LLPNLDEVHKLYIFLFQKGDFAFILLELKHFLQIVTLQNQIP
jgi:hypothetical protein